MSTLPYPAVEQLVTGIAVANGDVSVLTGNVLVSRKQSVAIEFDVEHLGEPLGRGHAITLMYSSDQMILRLRTQIEEALGDGRFLLKPVTDVSEGERREFLRANVEARVSVETHDGHGDLDGMTTHDVESFGGPLTSVDLSGSGIRMDCDVVAKKGDVLTVRLAIQDRPKTVLTLPGKVVRCKPSSDGALSNVAIHFLPLGEETQDQLINGVFRWYYEQIGGQLKSPEGN